MEISSGETAHIKLTDDEVRKAISEYTGMYFGPTWNLTGVKRTENPKRRGDEAILAEWAKKPGTSVTEFRFVHAQAQPLDYGPVA